MKKKQVAPKNGAFGKLSLLGVLALSTTLSFAQGQGNGNGGNNGGTSDPDFILITNPQTNEMGFLVDGKVSKKGKDQGNRNDEQFIAAPGTSLLQLNNYESSPNGSTSEIIGFTENSPVIINTNFDWTTASDTASFTFASEPIMVPITIWIVYAPNNDFAAQEQKALQDLMTTQMNYDKERLGLQFSEVTVIDATDDPDASNYYNFTCSSRSGLETDIGNVPGEINVYYLQTVDGSTTRGQSCTVGSNFSALGANAGIELQSHEIGHNLYLFHVDGLTSNGFNQTNIMHSASNTREFLTEGQTFRAHVAPQSSINDTYNARPGGITRNCGTTSTNTGDYDCPAIQTRIWSDN